MIETMSSASLPPLINHAHSDASPSCTFCIVDHSNHPDTVHHSVNLAAIHVKKSAHFVLGKRVPNTVEEDEDEYDEDQEEFEYESDPEDSCIINLGNWDRKRGAGVVTRVEYSENGDEQVDEDEEDDEAGGKDGEDVLEDGDENADDDIDDDGERDISGFEERIEREARAAGMTRMYKKSTMASDTTVNNKRQKKSTQPSMMTRRGGKTGEV